MTRARDKVSRRCEGERRIDQGVTQPDGDGARDPARDEVVLADRHVWPVLLGTPGVDDRGSFSGSDLLLHLGPGEILDVHRSLREHRLWKQHQQQQRPAAEPAAGRIYKSL